MKYNVERGVEEGGAMSRKEKRGGRSNGKECQGGRIKENEEKS